MYVKEIWRYPVKSMGGERLRSARLTESGIDGDRIIQVRNTRGRFVTSRTAPELLRFRTRLDGAGNPLIDGVPWTDPAIAAAVEKAAGAGSRLVRDEGVNRFDVLPLLVATDGAITAFGRDGRRLRPNIVVGGVTGLEEREWQGGALVIGDVVIGIHDLRMRCIMTTFDPDTIAHDPKVLRDIVNRFGGKLALNCDVLTGGEIHVDQEVELIGAREIAAKVPAAGSSDSVYR
jgi:uncharacterized protein YcbX